MVSASTISPRAASPPTGPGWRYRRWLTTSLAGPRASLWERRWQPPRPCAGASLLPGRTHYPQGPPPHPASAPRLALGKPVQQRPGPIACPATPLLTTLWVSDPFQQTTQPSGVCPPDRPSVSLAALCPALLALRRHLGPPTSPSVAVKPRTCTNPSASTPTSPDPSPLIPNLTGHPASLRWIRAKRSLGGARNELGRSRVRPDYRGGAAVAAQPTGGVYRAGGVPRDDMAPVSDRNVPMDHDCRSDSVLPFRLASSSDLKTNAASGCGRVASSSLST